MTPRLIRIAGLAALCACATAAVAEPPSAGVETRKSAPDSRRAMATGQQPAPDAPKSAADALKSPGEAPKPPAATSPRAAAPAPADGRPPSSPAAAVRTAAARPAPLACIRPLAAAEQPALNQRASLRLAEGISQFEQGRLVPAFHSIRTALTGGLTDPVEIAMANKYLAFYFCSTGARGLCEKHLETALLASPGFDLSPPEKTAAAWAEAYETVYRRLTVDCQAPDVQGPGARSGIFEDQPPSGIRATSTLMDGQSPAPAVLRLAVRPWGDVYLNGKRWLTTPPVKEVQLAPGRHRIEVRNGGLRSFVTDFTFAPGGQYLLRHDF